MRYRLRPIGMTGPTQQRALWKRMEDTMATLGMIAFTGLIAAQFLSVVYAAQYGSAVEVRSGR